MKQIDLFGRGRKARNPGRAKARKNAGKLKPCAYCGKLTPEEKLNDEQTGDPACPRCLRQLTGDSWNHDSETCGCAACSRERKKRKKNPKRSTKKRAKRNPDAKAHTLADIKAWLKDVGPKVTARVERDIKTGDSSTLANTAYFLEDEIKKARRRADALSLRLKNADGKPLEERKKIDKERAAASRVHSSLRYVHMRVEQLMERLLEEELRENPKKAKAKRPTKNPRAKKSSRKAKSRKTKSRVVSNPAAAIATIPFGNPGKGYVRFLDLPDSITKNPLARSAAIRTARRHGRKLEDLVVERVRVPRGASVFQIHVGDAHALEYVVPKDSKLAPYVYRHTAGDHGRGKRKTTPAAIGVDPKTGAQTFLPRRGTRLGFSERGITG